MPTIGEPHVTRNLQATADLLDALQQDPSLLHNDEFMKRLSILREKHEETTNYLARKVGAPPIPTIISSSKITENKTTNSSSKVYMTSSTNCHERYLDDSSNFPRRLDLKPNYKDKREESEYHVLQHNYSEDSRQRAGSFEKSPEDYTQAEPLRQHVPQPIRVHTSPAKVRVPIRVAPAVPTIPKRQDSQSRISLDPSYQNNSQTSKPVSQASGISRQNVPMHPRSSSLSRHHHSHRQSSASSSHRRELSNFTNTETVRQILADATSKHLVPTSVAMPSGLLLSSSNTKHMSSHQPPFANTSDVVEESFLEDGVSTTREVPTIIDEIVVERKPKNSIRKQKVNGSTINQTHRSKSLHNMSEAQVTVPRPFQLSLRKSIGNTYAKKFVTDMMTEKQRREEEEARNLGNTHFKAKPVPKSTYVPTNTFATERKYIEAMRKKIRAVARKKFEAQNEMIRSKSEGNLASIKPLGYVPPSTYVSPIPVKPNARSRSAVARSAILIQEATTPKGIKSHRAQSNLTHNLRHERCKLDTSAVVQHRRQSPPDFNKIHVKINDEYRKVNSKPSTVPMPFNFAKRSQSASSRHTTCKEKDPEPFKPSSKALDFTKNFSSHVPSTQATRLREELVRARIQKEKADNAEKTSLWADDNRKRISSFLGARSKTDENIAMLTRRRIQQQRETEEDYMRQLTEMKQRVLNGPLIMEKQTALAQEHRLKRKFELRMKTAAAANKTLPKQQESRRGSETSAAGTFVVEKDGYEDDFESKIGSGSKKSSSGSTSSESSRSSKSSSSKSSKSSASVKKSGSSKLSSSSSKLSSKLSISSESSEESSEEEDDESPR
ncbi:unnamed protein product [Caenorhabditis brenneri]